MKRIATLFSPGSFASPGNLLVGRTVANLQWLKALMQHGSMEEVGVIIGENADIQTLEALTAPWKLPLERMSVYSAWQLPELLQRGTFDALHHASHVDRLYDLLALRDRFAVRPTPVTGQIHSLSYPRLHQEHARWVFVPPSLTDGIFCSSTAGRTTMERTFELVEASARERGFAGAIPRWELPVVPLGVDLEAVTGGDRAAARARLKIAPDAVVLLSLARFTEYDKVDLFPLLGVLERLVHQPSPGAPEVVLLLAGARQGTKTPEMLQLWARALKVETNVRLEIDFADGDKKHLLAAADVFISPVDNLQETFGQSVVEALAAGLPCVVSDFDGYKDTVDEEVGVRVATRLGTAWDELSELAPLLYERPLHLVLGQSVEVDLRALEQALRGLILDPARRTTLGRAAAARARARYDWKRVVAQLEATWASLAARPWEPPARPHPLRLDFERQFEHFFTERISSERRLVFQPDRNEQVLYPELKSLMSLEDVARVREWLGTRVCTWRELLGFLASHLGDRRPWVASFIASWLVKHGVLVDAP